jgi:nitroreductase
MEYKDLITNRRSIRNFQDKPVPTGLLMEILSESTLAPSSGNGQPWKFAIINDKDTMKRISDESKKNLLKRLADNPGDYIKRYENALINEKFNVFYNAPALIIVAGPADHRNVLIDCSLCAVYIMNAAVSRGLGTCWINLGSDIRDKSLLNELGITADMKIVAPVIIGYPVSIPPIPKREEPVILKIMENKSDHV